MTVAEDSPRVVALHVATPPRFEAREKKPTSYKPAMPESTPLSQRTIPALIVVALLGAVMAAKGDALLKPFAHALVIMGIVAALGGAAAFYGLQGNWRRTDKPLEKE